MELFQNYKDEINNIIINHELDNNLFLWGTRRIKSKWPLIELLNSNKYSCLTYKPYGYYFVFSDNNTSVRNENDYYPSWSIEKKMNEDDTNRWGIQVAHFSHWLDSIQRTLVRSNTIKVPVAEGKLIRDKFRGSTKLLSKSNISHSTK
jgi:hypothetical protein